MTRDRSGMQGRVVPLRSADASDARVAGTAADRIALVAELSRRAWALTGRPLPAYTRATMPVRIVRLGEPDDAE